MATSFLHGALDFDISLIDEFRKQSCKAGYWFMDLAEVNSKEILKEGQNQFYGPSFGINA